MVSGADRQAWLLGTLMLAGSFAGVGIAAVAAAGVVLAGVDPRPWSLSFAGWWPGPCAGVQFVAGAGLLLLGATPVAMLAVFGWRAARQRRWSTLLTACGLAGILVLALVVNLGLQAP